MANMSSVMEKTLSSIPDLFFSAVKSKSHPGGMDELKRFMKTLDLVKSKQEEERQVGGYIAAVKEKLAKPNIANSEKRQSLTELLFVYMLGYDVSFCYIHAVKLAQQGNLLEKRTGYLLCSLFMSETHELAMLLINTIHKDLKNSDVLVVISALSAACQLVSCEMIPAVLPLVEEKLTHSSAVVRKKAVCCLHQFYRKANQLILNCEPRFIQALCDKDPSVMWAAVYLYQDLIQTQGAAGYRRLVPVFTDILMQVVSRKLPTQYDHKTVPAPWLSIPLLRILARLGHQCQTTSLQIYPVLREVSQRTEPTHTIGLAVISECVETICTIHPESSLLQFASKVVAKFLSAQNINIRYVGLRALSLLVAVDLKYTADHQKAVIEFLDHEDLTIQRQTFHLLFRMANPKNVQVISKKLLDCLRQSSDKYLQNDIVTKVLSLIQRYHTDAQYSECTQWYLSTVNQLLSTQNLDVPDNLASSLMDVLEHKPKPTLQTAVLVYWNVLQEQQLSEPLLQLACWVVSSHCVECTDLSNVEVCTCLLRWLSKSQSPDTHRVLVMGLRKLLPGLPQEQMPVFMEAIETALKRADIETMQILKELKVLSQNSDVLLAVTNGRQVEEMDFSLSFLDSYVCECLEKGDSPYKPMSFRTQKLDLCLPDQSLERTPLKLTPYESPVVGSVTSLSSGQSTPLVSGSVRSEGSTDSRGQPDLKLKGVKRVWGKEGFLTDRSQQHSDEPETENGMDNVSQMKSEEDLKREDFTNALFSGITTPEQSDTSPAKHSHKFITDTAEYSQLEDPGGNLPSDLNSHGSLAQQNVASLTHNHSTSEGLDINHGLSLVRDGVLHKNPVTMAHSHVIRDVAFDTDSLDGSVDLDAPPQLFHSEHEDLSLGFSRNNTKTDSNVYACHKEES